MRLNRWANAHTSYAIDALRVLLGAFIFYKGLFFFADNSYLLKVLEPAEGIGLSFILVHYIAMTHIAGGVLIMLGLLTRLSVLLQLPVLLGAMMINFINPLGAFELLQVIICLLLCCFFLFYGSGRHSLDYAMRLKM